jgi:hypothetical protein
MILAGREYDFGRRFGDDELLSSLEGLVDRRQGLGRVMGENQDGFVAVIGHLW